MNNLTVSISSDTSYSDKVLKISLTDAYEAISELRLVRSECTDLFGYFQTLDMVLNYINESGDIDLVEAAMVHVKYLATKADVDFAVILGGGHFQVEPQIILDALTNISALLRIASQNQVAGVPVAVFSVIVEAEKKLAGWCSREKALVIARLVLRERPKICVEIGIFGGRSLFPCAAALRHNGEGHIYGIEAWSPSVAIEVATNEANDDWWSKVDFIHIKQEFFRFVSTSNLTQYVRVIEAPSRRAAALFDQIDFLHIDGSHSVVNAAEDLILYARKVRSGGIIIFDDINWQSTALARELLYALCDPVKILTDPESGLDICAVMRMR